MIAGIEYIGDIREEVTITLEQVYKENNEVVRTEPITIYYKSDSVRIESPNSLNGDLLEIYNANDDSTYSVSRPANYADYQQGNKLYIKRLSLDMIEDIEKDPTIKDFEMEIKSNELFIEIDRGKNGTEKFWYSMIYGIPLTYYAQTFDDEGWDIGEYEWQNSTLDDSTDIDDNLFDIPKDAKELN